MISSSSNKSEINKCDGDMNIQNNNLNKIEEKEDNKEESNRTGTIGHPLSNRIEEEKQEDENSNPKVAKSSISSASDDEEKKANNIENNENNEKENINIQGNNNKEGDLIEEKEKSDKKSSGSYGLLGDDKNKSSGEKNKEN